MEGDSLWPLAEIREEMASRTCRYGGCRGMSVCAFRRVLIRSPTEGSRVEEEAGLSFFYFFIFFFSCGLSYWFCFPLCNIVQAICIDWENAFYTVFHNKVLNVHISAVSL